MTQKTQAMRILDGKKIPYEVIVYDDQMRDAEVIAQQIGVDPGVVFKSLVVVRSSGKPILVMLAADKQLNLKQMARSVGEKRVSMASHQQAEQLTGLQVGGISALALLNRGFDIYADKGMEEREWIFVSAGKRGLQLEVRADDLIRLTGAKIAPVAY